MMDRELGPVSTKADMWALGCTMITMSGGILYSADMSSIAIARQVCDKKVAPKLPAGHGLAKALEDIVKQCLELDYSKRPEPAIVLQVCHSTEI